MEKKELLKAFINKQDDKGLDMAEELFANIESQIDAENISMAIKEAIRNRRNLSNKLINEETEEESKSKNKNMTIELLFECNLINSDEYDVLNKHNIKNMKNLIDFDFNELSAEESMLYKDKFKLLKEYLNYDEYIDNYGPTEVGKHRK